MTKKHLIIACLMLSSIGAFAQNNSEPKGYDLWEHLYMPLEMGISFSTNPNQDPGYLVNTALEYRFNRLNGLFIMGEYDEHAHDYQASNIQEANSVEGEIRYTDFLIGPGWRKPLFKNISATALAQMGFTVSTLKEVNDIETGERYHLADNKKVVPAAKMRLGIEYVFDPAFNIYVQFCHTLHLSATQLEMDGTKGVINISAGVNFSFK